MKFLIGRTVLKNPAFEDLLYEVSLEREVLSENDPLCGRTAGILKIQEMDFSSARGFFPEVAAIDQVKYYGVFSGVPYYLSLINPDGCFRDNVQKIIMANGAPLFSETEFLLKQELREVNVYNAIIEAIALGRTKVNEIVQVTGIEKTSLSYYMKNLIDLGIVKKEFPSTLKTKERIKSRAGLYKLENAFFRFYYAFVYPSLSELADGNGDIIYEEIVEKQLPGFIGLEFENIALQDLRVKNRNKTLPYRLVKMGRWWDKQLEIDIVGYDVNDNYVFGECKWRNEKVGLAVLETLIEKSTSLKTRINGRFYILYSKSGFTKALIERAETDPGVQLIEVSELR